MQSPSSSAARYRHINGAATCESKGRASSTALGDHSDLTLPTDGVSFARCPETGSDTLRCGHPPRTEQRPAYASQRLGATAQNPAASSAISSFADAALSEASKCQMPV